MLKVIDAKGGIFEKIGAVPHCDNARVAADLTDDRSLAEGLRSAGFNPSAPSVFLAEGLIMYLMGEGASWKGEVGTDYGVVGYSDTAYNDKPDAVILLTVSKLRI